MRYQLLILLFVIPAFAFCQASKGGLKVFIENAEQDDIIAATVLVMDGERQVAGGVTDFQGFLYIPNIEAGTYTVVIRHVSIGEFKFLVKIRSNSIYELRREISSGSACFGGHGLVFRREPILGGPFVATYSAEDILTNPGIYRN